MSRISFSRVQFILVMMLVTVQAGAVFAQTPGHPLAERPLPVINVSGEGSAMLKPDMAIVQFGVVQEARTAREALSANNAAMDNVISAMREAGIESRDLQTSGFSIQPRYVYPENRNNEQNPPRIVGYSVSNQLTVRIRDIALVGEILDRAVTLGVNSNGNIAFTNDDPSQAIAKARIAAIKDARERAQTLVEAADARLGMLLQVSENLQHPAPSPMMRNARKMEMAASDAVPVEAGENRYSVTVQTSWEILQ
jgi:uncharacterized protein